MALHPKGFDLSLGRITRLLERLGNPQDRLPPVIHVAGTNGKGSTSAFCRAILEAQGLKVHVHTSPHLVNWHERFRLGAEGGGRLVADEVLADAVRRVANANQGEMITVFEILTAVMFVLFSEHPADAAVIEVGLGGRFDATNVMEHPAASVIMSISLDHQAYLGDHVELIAAEKAGIIKRGTPVVIGAQTEDAARDVLIASAERLGCPTSVYGQDFFAVEENGRMAYQDEEELIDLPLPKLAGRHQQANAAAAIRALKAAGFKLDETAIAEGLVSVSWPGRLERLTYGRLVENAMDGAELWIDGGHNPGAGRVIAEAMANLNDRESRPLFLITGMINTKDPVGYFEAFEGMARHVFTVPVPDSDAGLDPEFLADTADEAGLSAESAEDVEAAIAAICSNWNHLERPPRILIGGSLYLLGAVLKVNGTPPV
ncbi:MAG: folylpolyglutamate synthase/dihydrofolate synthase family protein [Hoeflea sp.]|uniref:bifunctional folylpolyglutamate synthase/dihydrofolate synthase n=1 Tax=Hoeflea sp. TaxID=1940281 RepID=UPI002731876E|nr:folylpolyglutamate synthase/dihydrofolate synthase family protein [Hoeflea sp.]MDP2120292.1 folylpolyglutamate synthase/dihydrofolate synthase family protein [Hoeflea sp.]MDP3525743.1 folylpolyglutamate synthase/dihydrofolate synthase family protein [Hoeflea sp.]